MSTVLACDLGGTSFRAALIDEAGATLAERTIPGPASQDCAGASEIAPEAWWDNFRTAVAGLAQDAPDLFGRVQGIAICGITRTQVFLDKAGKPLRPAMTWKDTRAEAVARKLAEELPAAHPERAQVNAFHPLARLAWLRQEEPGNFAALACILEPKDYLNFRLTRQRASDPVSLARPLAAAKPADGIDLLTAIGASPSLLPPILEPCDRVGLVEPGLPAPLDQLAGIPVLCCSNDTWTAVLGLGALREGYAYNISGTTEVLGMLGAEPVEAEGLLTVDWRGLFQLGGPSQNGADTVSWLLALLGRGKDDVGRSMEELLAGPRHPQPVLFLPYLQGERVPYWDPNLRGAFIGLGRQHGPADLAWAVLEGVACLNRIVLERAEAASGGKVTEIRFGGGAAANPVWRQVKADICGRPVVVGAAREPGALGAAIVAWTGLGRFASLGEAQERLVSRAARHEPDPARAGFYDRLHALYCQSEAALAPISHALVALSPEA